VKKASYLQLSRRERQIMDVLYREGRASAVRVREGMAEPPGDSTVRTLLRVLEEKGFVRHEVEGLQYIYRPAVPRREARGSALSHLVATFFDGSTEEAVVALLKRERLSRRELDRLSQLIDAAKKEGARDE
jgi:predicted transcriptional regulator